MFLRLRRQHPFLHKTKGPTRNPISPTPPPSFGGRPCHPPAEQFSGCPALRCLALRRVALCRNEWRHVFVLPCVAFCCLAMRCRAVPRTVCTALCFMAGSWGQQHTRPHNMARRGTTEHQHQHRHVIGCKRTKLQRNYNTAEHKAAMRKGGGSYAHAEIKRMRTGTAPAPPRASCAAVLSGPPSAQGGAATRPMASGEGGR